MNCDHEPEPANLKRKLVQSIIILNVTVMLYQNRLIIEGAREITKVNMCVIYGDIILQL